MEKVWLKQYQSGVPETINVDEYRSAAEVFDQSAKRFSDRPAFSNAIKFASRTMSYGEIDAASRNLAAYLQQGLGLKKGDRVAVMMPNLLQYPICVFGILRAGLTVVNVNPLYTPRELEHQLKDSGASAIIIVANFAHVLAEVIGKTQVKHTIVTEMGDMLGFKGSVLNVLMKHVKKMVPAYHLPQAVSFKGALALGQRHELKPTDVGHDDIAFLQYTGGTTGVSKGAMLTNRNIIANMQQAHAWLMPLLKEGQEVIVCALPLYHIFCLTANCMVFSKIGGLNVLITNPRDIPAFVEELGRHPITCMTGVNTLFNALLNNPDFSKLNFKTWKMALGGGMATQRAVVEKFKETTGVPLIEAYGLTETSPAACINPMNQTSYNGTIGLPI
ncbi:AMP-binding protein, partial [Chitinimonas sp.]|uniref:AMP-binding protein n=1 Tax=Chitinimonas sp. TaxID=1934313 RepID=UPI0035B158C9